MNKISRTTLVPFSNEQMFNLVNDIKQYPNFLPNCSASNIISTSATNITASLEVSKLGVTKTFTTSNDLLINKAIIINLVDGPFKNLKGRWLFTPLDEKACHIEFQLEFEFTNAMTELAFGKIFQTLTSNIVDAFTKRAKLVYN